jgi:two-component system chemotaxis response regulator CheY
MTKVLIVDDSPTIRQQVGRALNDSGFETVDAGDGVEGIAMLGADTAIGMVILDINMPRMGGLEMLEKIKKDERTAHVPVVMLTSEGQRSLIERAKQAGAKGWIVKPFKPELLVGAVRKLLSEQTVGASS